MQYLDLTLPEVAENLALDEALLEEAESATVPMETLRVWESHQPAVVVGRSSHIDTEVRVDACRQLGIPIFRRISGGASVVVGPGCLMYSLVLSFHDRPKLRMPNEAHREVLNTLAMGLSTIISGVRCRGTSDLTLNDWKFSGNSVRSRRTHLLYHGTLLYDFPLAFFKNDSRGVCDAQIRSSLDVCAARCPPVPGNCRGSARDK